MLESDKGVLTIAVIGLGYVGLPLAVEFSNFHKVIGFDVKLSRIDELRNFKDNTLEVEAQLLRNPNLKFSSNEEDLSGIDVFIVTVPTPIDKFKVPNLVSLKSASALVGKYIQPGKTVVFESTVYPGVTEDICASIISKKSGLILNKDYFIGYSPERINPGDKQKKLKDIVKITSGSNENTRKFVDALYKDIIKAGTYSVDTIKVAEAAKIIENVQRDVNIALMNEFADLFNKFNISVDSVLAAARTKWNFLDFRPGLVGGHCIGVDPYYLSYAAQSVGHSPKMILSGRAVNEAFSKFIAEKFVKCIFNNVNEFKTKKVLVMGVTFKENCPDLRNSKVFDLVLEIEKFGFEVDIFDPYFEYFPPLDLKLVTELKSNYYEGVCIAVAHREFLAMGIDAIQDLSINQNCIFDLKNLFENEVSILRL
ncbi:nucleotide sugar dehydrogenase [Alphaproteobacteria bacterium]|nr:nucleotide sugar dehydrogenase [Alphaproteobacteria bacterium]